MPLIRDDAIILQSLAYSETSKILRLLTRSHGVRSVIAKGAMRPRSRFCGLLEPFTVGIATIYLKEGRELQTLGGFDLLRSGQSLGRDLLRFGGASLLAELIVRTAVEEHQPGLYHRLLRALDRIECAPAAELESVLLAEAWGLVADLGYAPILDHCTACGRALDPDEDGVFDYPAGGVRCRECAGGVTGRTVPAAARANLSRLVAGVAVALERTRGYWILLDRFIAHHVADGATIRSLPFLAEVLQP